MPPAMPESATARAARYRKRAAELRHLAGQIPQHDVNCQQLLSLAEDFEEFADSLAQGPLGSP